MPRKTRAQKIRSQKRRVKLAAWVPYRPAWQGQMHNWLDKEVFGKADAQSVKKVG